MAATWRFVVPWMRVSAQRSSQRSRYACASSRLSKRSPLSGVFCAWPTPDSDFALAIWIAGCDTASRPRLMREHVAIERIERGIVNVGDEHAFAQIVEDHDARRSAQPAKGALVQFRPDARAGTQRQQTN